MDRLDSQDIYLQKDGRIIGLHAIGYNTLYDCELVEIDGTSKMIKMDFMALQKWGNEYNQEMKVLPLGSFHVFDLTIRHAAQDLEKDGWVRFDPFSK